LFEVNFWGAVHCLRAVVPHMRRRKQGLIINVSSVAGRIASPYNAIYCATKAALISLSDALRLELAEDGIRVLTVYPGFTATEFGRNAIKEIELPASRVFRGTPASAVARVIVKAARRGQREAFVTFGDGMAVGLKNLAPRLVDWGLRRLWLASRRPRPLAGK
ncbi:MAG: SDR family NAD(P)-dependent oxidoreductase, partial [Dehalococcoidia bacterium]